MRSYRYLHLDVFTSTAFEGNQLAVFPEPHGLTAELMQTIFPHPTISETMHESVLAAYGRALHI